LNISLLLVQSILTTDECKHCKIRPLPEAEDAKKENPGKCERKIKKEKVKGKWLSKKKINAKGQK
jgi:hypothetical protein